MTIPRIFYGFLQKRPEIHIFAARFKENNQDIPGARAEFQLLHTEISPGYLEAVVKHANMEYRQVKLYELCTIIHIHYSFVDDT